MGMVPPRIVSSLEQNMISQLEYVRIGKDLTIENNLVYLVGHEEPIGYFDERGNYCSLESEPPKPQYEEMLISYPENKPV